MNKIYYLNKQFKVGIRMPAHIKTLLLIYLLYNNFVSAQAPSTILPDIVNFKLEFPLDANGNDYTGVEYGDRNNPLIKNHIEGNLNNFVAQAPYDEYFYTTNNELVFKAHCAGALTSSNAYPRCELRQQINGTDSFWDFSNKHELNATFRVTHLPDIKKEVCMLQIKGNTSLNTSGTKEAFRLEYREESDGLHITKNEYTKISYVMPYSIGQTIAAKLYVNNDSIDVQLTNLNTGDVYIHSYKSNYPYGYFKAGCYTQSSIWKEKNGVGDEAPDAYGEVRFSELTLSSLTCEANPPTNLQATDIFPDNAVLTWDPVATINSYDLRYRPIGGTIWTYENGLNTILNTQIYGLSNYTNYEWQLKAHCPDGTSSAWSISSYFQTADCKRGTNIAQYGTVVSYSSQEPDNPATNLIDIKESRWSAEGFPSEVVIDLGNTHSIDAINLYPFNDRDYQFIVQGSTTSATSGFMTMIDASNNSDGGAVITKTFPAQDARFVKLIVTGAATYTGTWSSIEELEILCSGGNPPPPPNCTPTIPTNLFTNNIDSTTAVLNWNTNAAISNHDLRYRIVGDATWMYKNGLGVVSNTTIIGLSSSTDYEWQLKANCLDGTSSAWSVSSYFQTQATAFVCNRSTNLAQYGTVVSYSTQDADNPASNIIDLNENNRWSAEGFPQEIIIDLGSAYSIDVVNLYPFKDRDYQFIIQGSTISATSGFTTMIDASNNSDGGAVITKTFPAQDARFVKLIVTGAATYTGTWSSIEELEILCLGEGPLANCTPTAPTNLFVSNISSFTAVLNWDNNPYVDNYSVRYRKAGTPWNYQTSFADSVLIGGLSPDTAYEWEVRAECNDGSVTTYDLGQGTGFITAQVPVNNECDIIPITNPRAHNLTNNGVTFTWDDIPNIDHYNLRYRPIGSLSWIYEYSLQSNSVNITGLSSNIQYEWQVRAKCGNSQGTEYQHGSGPDFTPGQPRPIPVKIRAFLEGGLLTSNNNTSPLMHTTLNDFGLLPGQTLQGTNTVVNPSGQPYNIFPWNYNGGEGAGWTNNEYADIEAIYSSKVVDWVLVTFRSNIMASSNFIRAAALLLRDGRVVFPQGSPITDAFPISFYVMVEHRNHIGVLTPMATTIRNTSAVYDFTVDNSYGGNGQKKISPNIWVMFAGEIIHELAGFDINGADKVPWTDENGKFLIYTSTDLNMDGDINGQDKIYWFNNNGISSGLSR